jgi:hypothetical protein
MEQSPDELSGHEGETSEEEIDKITSEPMDSPDKQREAEADDPASSGTEMGG